MTTGSIVADATETVSVYRSPNNNFLGTGKIGSYSSRVWTGSDRPTLPKVAAYNKQFYRVPILTRPKPARYVRVKVWKKKRVRRYFPGEGWKKITVRERITKVVHKPATPGGKFTGEYKLRYKKVPNPKPPKQSAPENPYSCTHIRWRDSLAEYSQRVWPYPDVITDRHVTVAPNFWFNGAAPAVVNPWDSNDDIAALGKLREKVAGSDFNFAVFLAEGSQSLKMIANAATRISKSLTALKKGNLQKAWKHLSDDKTPRGLSPRKEASSNWLEMQYGWLPLLQDAEGGAQFLAHLHSGGTKQIVRSSKRKVHFTARPPGKPGFWYDQGFHSETMHSIKCILTDVSPVSLSGLTDPLSVAWEKIPYSFVVDWFIPIGNYLAARGLAASLQGTFVVTKTTRTSYAGSNFATSDADPWRAAFVPSACFYRSVTIDRTVTGSLPVPLPAVKPLHKALSWKRAANAVALLSQLHR